MRNYFRAITTILLGVAVWLFWGLGYPEALNYQEQNQLWLTTGDYFRERMAVPRAWLTMSASSWCSSIMCLGSGHCLSVWCMA